MSDLLAIVGPSDAQDTLVDEIAMCRPNRVTVLVQDGDRDWALDESGSGRALRDRLAELLHAIEQRPAPSSWGWRAIPTSCSAGALTASSAVACP